MHQSIPAAPGAPRTPPPPVKNYVWRVYSGLNGVRPEPWDAGRQKNGVASGGAGKTERQQNRLRWAKQIK